MASRQIRSIFEGYCGSHDASYFADDAILAVVPLRQEFHGRAAIRGFLNLFYREAFSYAWADLQRATVDAEQGVCVAEFTFKGRHTGEWLGIPATTRTVELSMLEIHEFREGQVRRARFYYDAANLLWQLGASPDMLLRAVQID